METTVRNRTMLGILGIALVLVLVLFSCSVGFDRDNTSGTTNRSSENDTDTDTPDPSPSEPPAPPGDDGSGPPDGSTTPDVDPGEGQQGGVDDFFGAPPTSGPETPGPSIGNPDDSDINVPVSGAPTPDADPATCANDPALCPPPPPAPPPAPGGDNGGGDNGGGDNGGGDNGGGDNGGGDNGGGDNGGGDDGGGDTPDTTPPSRPDGLRTELVAWNSAIITWTASTDNVAVTRYRISLNGEEIGSVSGAKVLLRDLSPLTLYTITVEAQDARGNTSPASLPLPFFTPAEPDTSAPTAPANLAADDIGMYEFTATWDASADEEGEIDFYTVSIDGEERLQVDASGDLSALIDGLEIETEYILTVTATDDSGNESPPASITVTTTKDTEAPTAPTTFNAVDVTDRRVTLNWTDDATDNVEVVSYELARNGSVFTTMPAGGSTSFRFAGLQPGTTSTFAIRAKDAEGNVGDQRTVVVATPGVDTTAPGPIWANFVYQGHTYWQVAWTQATDNWTPAAKMRYQVIVNGAVVATHTGYSTNIYVGRYGGLTVQVRAIDEAGNVSASRVLTSPEPIDGETGTPRPPGPADPPVDDDNRPLPWPPEDEDEEDESDETDADQARREGDDEALPDEEQEGEAAADQPDDTPAAGDEADEVVELVDINYVGRHVADVEADLQDLGLNVEQVLVVNDGTEQPETVSDLSEEGEVLVGSTVELLVWDEPAEDTSEEAPVEAPAEEAPEEEATDEAPNEAPVEAPEEGAAREAVEEPSTTTPETDAEAAPEEQPVAEEEPVTQQQ